MSNFFFLIGRLTSTPELKTSEKGKQYTNIRVAVPQQVKNEDGVYETDFFDCVVFGSNAVATSEYCKKGDLLGIKGRLKTNKNKVEMTAEKITFLSQSKSKVDEDIEITKNI